jgi:hypothetical protein
MQMVVAASSGKEAVTNAWLGPAHGFAPGRAHHSWLKMSMN